MSLQKHDGADTHFKPFGGESGMPGGKRPTVGCDCVILVRRKNVWQVLLIERGHDPYKGKWALPGGFMEWGESCERAAARELEEETSLKNVQLKLLGVFSKPGRDPRGTIVSVSYIGIVEEARAKGAAGGDDAAKAAWFPLDRTPGLAFDHDEILASAKDYLRTNKL